ncbi:hypothetical protein [Microbispora sp. H10830]|nr:hypothetical protein [Microbispora sp. H10830]
MTRRHQPVAAVVSIRRLNELEEAAADLRAWRSCSHVR